MSRRHLLTGAISSLRRDGNDLATTTGRSRERYRRAAVTSAAGIGARATSTLALLIAIGVVNRAVGTEALGLWLLLVSAVALVGFADLGIGYGLLNRLAQARGRDDIDGAHQSVSSAFFALSALAACLAVVTALVFPFVPWSRILDLPDTLAEDGRAAIAVFFACAIVSLPLAVAPRVHLALQEGYWAHLWASGGSILSLVAVVVVARVNPSLPWLTLAMLGGLPVAYLANSVALFGYQHRELRPRVSQARRRDASAILRTGSVFFVLTLAYSIGFQADTIIISHYLGPGAVASYSVPLRLFLLTPLLTSLLVAPLWPAYGEAIQRNDHAWVRRTIIRSVGLTLALVVPGSIFFLVAARPIIAVWVPSLDPSTSLLAWMALWAIVFAVTTTVSMFFNGASVLRLQMILAVSMAATNLVLSIVLVQRVGVEGPVIGSVVAQAVVVLVPMVVVLRPLLAARDDSAVHRWLQQWSTPDAAASFGRAAGAAGTDPHATDVRTPAPLETDLPAAPEPRKETS